MVVGIGSTLIALEVNIEWSAVRWCAAFAFEGRPGSALTTYLYEETAVTLDNSPSSATPPTIGAWGTRGVQTQTMAQPDSGPTNALPARPHTTRPNPYPNPNPHSRG